MSEEERDPSYMIENQFLEKLEDFEHDGKQIQASRLGYRITSRFSRYMLGRIFDTPTQIFTPEMIKPELQDMDAWVDGILNITEAQERVARGYLSDGSVDAACPPLKALLHIMADGSYEGKTVHDPKIRELFTRESMIQSDWYKERLKEQQTRDIQRWTNHVQYLETFLEERGNTVIMDDIPVHDRLSEAKEQLKLASKDDHWKTLVGCLGVSPYAGLTHQP